MHFLDTQNILIIIVLVIIIIIVIITKITINSLHFDDEQSNRMERICRAIGPLRCRTVKYEQLVQVYHHHGFLAMAF